MASYNAARDIMEGMKVHQNREGGMCGWSLQNNMVLVLWIIIRDSNARFRLLIFKEGLLVFFILARKLGSDSPRSALS